MRVRLLSELSETISADDTGSARFSPYVGMGRKGIASLSRSGAIMTEIARPCPDISDPQLSGFVEYSGDCVFDEVQSAMRTFLRSVTFEDRPVPIDAIVSGTGQCYTFISTVS